jgi:hypothetical protein
MANGEGYVQVALDGNGKKVRNLALDVVQADGTVATVYQQVVAITDDRGHALNLDPGNVVDLLARIHDELVATRSLVEEAFGLDLKQSLAKKGGRHFSMIDKER